jgi:hypothetical protein
MSRQRLRWRGVSSGGFRCWRRGTVILPAVLAVATGHATGVWAPNDAKG